MKNLFSKSILLASSVFLGSTAAYAACPQSNLAGTWEVFIAESTDNSNVDSWWSCSLVIDRAGTIVTGPTSVCESSDAIDFPTTNVSGSVISIANICAINGASSQITIDGNQYTIYDGQISRSKADMSGVGFSPIGHFVFNAIKR